MPWRLGGLLCRIERRRGQTSAAVIQILLPLDFLDVAHSLLSELFRFALCISLGLLFLPKDVPDRHQQEHEKYEFGAGQKTALRS